MHKSTCSGTWRVFTGNEMGAILAHYVFTEWRRKNPDKNRESLSQETPLGVIPCSELCAHA